MTLAINVTLVVCLSARVDHEAALYNLGNTTCLHNTRNTTVTYFYIIFTAVFDILKTIGT